VDGREVKALVATWIESEGGFETIPTAAATADWYGNALQGLGHVQYRRSFVLKPRRNLK